MEKPDFRNYENSEEGLAQYDAAVAAYNRQQEGQKIGTELADTVEQGFQQISQVPVFKEGLQFLGAGVRFIDETMSQDQGTGGMIYRTYQDLQEKAQQGGEFYADKLGVDPRIGRFVGGEIFDAAATAGLGKLASAASKVKLPPASPQLATAGVAPMGLAPSASNGSISLRPQVLEAKRDKFYNQGEWNVTQGKRIDEARDAVDAAREIMENIKDANPGVKHGELRKTIPEYKAADKALRAKMPRISSEESNLLAPSKGREQAYPPAKPRAKELKGIFTRQARREKVRKGVDQIIEQVDLHHKFPKGISAAFFNRGRDLIEDGVMTYNDLVNMAKRAQKKGIEPGDIETNLEPMFKTPHDTFHAEMRAQPSYQFPGDNLEISKTKLTQRLRKVKNKKDLNELWNQLLSEDAKYLYETAEIWQPMDKVIKSVSPEYTGTAKSKK